MSKKSVSRIIGTRIAIARKSKNWEQKDLAIAVNISQAHLSRIESGKRGLSAQLLFAIALALEIDERDLNPYRSINIWGNPKLPI